MESLKALILIFVRVLVQLEQEFNRDLLLFQVHWNFMEIGLEWREMEEYF